MIIEWILPLLVGWVSGWVVNYLSDVLPYTRKFSKPACVVCGNSLSIKNFLLFQPCINGHARSGRSWLVQVSMMILSLYTFTNPAAKIGYILGILLIIYLGVVFVIDMEHRLIIHPTSIVGGLLAFALGTISHGLVPTLLGGLGGLGIMLIIYYFGVIFSRIRATKMRTQGLEADDEEALGQGDVILTTVLGLLVGWPLIWFMILISALLGGIVSIFLVLGLVVSRRYNANALMIFIPYGPYLVIGAALIIFFPNFLQIFLPS